MKGGVVMDILANNTFGLFVMIVAPGFIGGFVFAGTLRT
jgi:hypothetical protein